MSKVFNLYILSVLVLFGFISCKNTEAEVVSVNTKETKQVKTLNPNATYAKAEFKIEGMTCAMGCAKTIEKKMAKMDGVKSAKVDFEKELAMVEYDEAIVTPNNLEETVAKAGENYKVKNMQTVESFSSEEQEMKSCAADCKKDCCKDKNKDDKKMACAEDCKKACCAMKA